MSIIVTHDAQASHLHKPTASKGSSNDDFAQVMQALASKPDTSRDAETAFSNKEDVDEEVEPEDQNEDDSTGLESVSLPQVVATVLRDGVGSPVAKSNIQAPLPLAFIAQGWKATAPGQQVLQSAPAPVTDETLPGSIVEARGLHAALSQVGTAGNADEIADYFTREVNRSSQGIASQGQPLMSATLQGTGLSSPEISRQVGTINSPEDAAVKAKLEPQLTRDAASGRLPQIETQTSQSSAVFVAQVNKAAELPLDPLLQSEGALDELGELELTPLAGGERSGVMSIGATDAKPASQAQVATAVAQQLAVAVQKNPNGVTELVLNPEELGRVKLSMVTHDGVLSMTITTERPETQDLMRRHIETLAQELRELGFEDVGFSFRGQGQDDQQQSSPEHDMSIAMSEAEPALPAPQDTQTSGLDLRL